MRLLADEGFSSLRDSDPWVETHGYHCAAPSGLSGFSKPVVANTSSSKLKETVLMPYRNSCAKKARPNKLATLTII